MHTLLARILGASLPSLALLSACSDSSVTTQLPSATVQPAWSLSGVAFKGAISNGRACVMATACGGNAAQPLVELACTQSDAAGNYAMTLTPAQITDSCGPYAMRVQGGTYVDEATGQSVPLVGSLFAYMGESVSSVNGMLDRQALMAAGGVNATAAGSGGEGIVVDDGDGGPFVGSSLPTTNSAPPSTKTEAFGTFNVTLLSTMQLQQALNAPGGLNDTNTKKAQTDINTNLGLHPNLNLVVSTPKNGNSSFDQALFSLAQMASDKGVPTVLNTHPALPSFQTDFKQAQTQVPNLPTNWIFASTSVPNGTRTALLPTGEMNLPGLGTLQMRRNATNDVEVLAPAGVVQVYSWLGGRLFTFCGSGSTLLGTVVAPNNDGIIVGEAGYGSPSVGKASVLGCNSISYLNLPTSSSGLPNVNFPRGAGAPVESSLIGVNNGAIRVGSTSNFVGQALKPADLAMAPANTIASAKLPTGSYLLWVGGNANATNNYGNIFSNTTTQTYVVTGNTSDTLTNVPVFQNNADGRAFALGNSLSNRVFAAGFIEPAGKVALLCERNALGRLFGSSAMTRVDPAQLSAPVSANQIFGRNWRTVQSCALLGGPAGPTSFNYTSAQGWLNSFASPISATQMISLLMPSSTGIAASGDTTHTSDMLFYSAFITSGSGATAQLVMVERRIAPDGITRDIRLFYSVP